MRSEPAAVIGMACRFPCCFSPQAFWKALKDGRRLVSDFSPEELRAAGANNELLADKNFVRSYGFLEGTDLFDPAFFGMLKREADILDPQHRLFLECCVEALHDARLEVKQEKAQTAVFAGCLISNYLHLNHQDGQLCIEDPDQFLLELGNDKDFLPLRASYLLGLTGPSVNVNAGCATSLVALHLACQSLRSRECNVAIAGAASIRHYQPTGYLYRVGGVLSPDGRCRPFDADAKGTVFGDGVACVVIKRLDDALKDGDRIYGLILGSAMNNDGRDRGSFVAPSVSGQCDVIAAAYKAAEISPETISYVEAHGTATPLGDRVEMQALTSAFRQFTTGRDFCGLGSVKSNCGHLDAASGMAGLFKTLLSFNYNGIPKTLYHNSPNPFIDFRSSPFHLVTEFTPWPRGEHPRRAGLSSFGMGGVNVHMVLEEPPAGTLTWPSEGTATSDPAPISFNRVRCWATPRSRHEQGQDLALDADEELAGKSEDTIRRQTNWRSWIYEPLWRENEQAVSTSSAEKDLFVVLGAEHPVATELINELQCSGASQCLPIARDVYRSQSGGRATFVDTKELFSKVRGIMKGHTGRRLNIVDFGFADFRRASNEDAADTALLAYMRALSLLRQLALEFNTVPVAVTLVTAGAAGVLDGEENNPSLASILGPILVAPQEHSNLLTRNIDLPEVISAREWKRTARTLLRAIISAENYPQIAVRGEKYFVQEFTPLLEAPRRPLIKEGGVYLILGGIGSVGPTIASVMLGAGAKHVVVTRRTALPERSTREGEDGQAKAPILTEFGPSILAASVDVNDQGALSLLVNEIASMYGRIDGIVHAAAIPGWETFEFIAESSEAHFLKQAAPKINGAINLFKILSDRPGTFCLVLSSLASQLGGLGLCAYSAVSNFVDAFVAHCRTRYGMSWTTINLDNWVLSDQSQSRELFGNTSSIPRITPEEGERIFSHLFSFSVPGQVLVSKQDLDARMSSWRRHLGKTPSTEKRSGIPKTSFAGAGKEKIKRTLVVSLKKVLEVKTVDEQASFQDLGGDSLQAIEILEVIRETYGVNLEMFELVNASRLDDLVAAIFRRLSMSSNAELVDIETIKDTSQKLVITLRKTESPPTLFLVHPHGGGVSCYRALVTHLKYGGAICGIRIPGLYGECDVPTSVEQMADAYVRAIKDYQQCGPYLIGGFSAGGIIAFEICRQLQSCRDNVSQLIMIDTLAPHHARELARSERVDEATFLAEVFLGMIDLPVAKLRELSDSEARAWAVKEWEKAGLVTDSFSVENLEPIRRVFYRGLRIYGAYEPQRSAFERVLFIKCIQQPPDECYREEDLGWGKYIQENLVVRQVPGSHSQLMSPEYVSELARQIDESLGGI